MRHPRCPLRFRCRVPTTGLALALLALASCGGRGPYPVEGKIVVKGDPFPVKELQGYTIMFQSQTEPVVTPAVPLRRTAPSGWGRTRRTMARWRASTALP